MIDQAFDTVIMADDLLAPADVMGLIDTEGLDSRLHQGFFILARLTLDMRRGAIPLIPMMILTHYARMDLASSALGFGVGYSSKRRLLKDPYAVLHSCLPQVQPMATGALGNCEEPHP
jgi:hypothetical protein